LLKHPTLDQLNALGLHGMAKAFVELAANGQADGLGHHEWLGLLLDREASWRQGFSWWEGCSLGDAGRHARRLGLWIALAGQAGSAADEDFPGLAALVRPDGTVAARLPDWRPGVLTVDIPL